MQEIKQIVKDYLETPKTDYALMIKGDWGSGKTYFVKNSLFDFINEIKSYETDDEQAQLKYNSSYISLFGISSANEINEKIQLELNPWMKSKAWTIAKTGLNKVASLFNVGMTEDEEKKFISIINIKKNNVLFFDDLERIERKENLPSILGQINQLTEHQNLKVIIVCNSKKADELFSKTNEKTIRFSTLYQPDIRSIYDEIIKNYDAEYNPFLNDKKDFILKIFEEVSYNNLRTLRFILDIFQKVFETTKPEKYKNEILEQFLLFLTIFSIENKEGSPPECLNKLKEFGPWEIDFDNILLPADVKIDDKDIEPEGKSEEEKYIEGISKKYKRYTEEFHYSHQLALYIDSGYLDTEKLKNEIQEIEQELKRKEDSEETKTIQAIHDWRNIEADNFATLIEITLGKVGSGTMSLSAYLPILNELLRIEIYQIEDFKVTPEIVAQFKKGIDSSKINHKYDIGFEVKLPRCNEKEDKSFKEKFNEIRKYLVEANLSTNEIDLDSLKDIVLEYLVKDKAEELIDFYTNLSYQVEHPFLKEADPNEYFTKFIESNKKTQEAFDTFLRGRYYNIKVNISIEQDFLKGLLSKIDEYLAPPKVRTTDDAYIIKTKISIEFFLKQLED